MQESTQYCSLTKSEARRNELSGQQKSQTEIILTDISIQVLILVRMIMMM